MAKKNLKVRDQVHKKVKAHVRTLGMTLEAWTERVLLAAIAHKPQAQG